MKIAVSGIGGKMGRNIASLILQDPLLELVSCLVRSGSNLVGSDCGEFLGFDSNSYLITDDIEKFVSSAEAIIDFSSPNLSIEISKICAKLGKVMVCGTTGFSEQEKKELKNSANSCPIIWSSNMSIGVNLLMTLVEKVAATLHDDFDIEILEMHHKNKVDAPSGTALSLGLAAAKGRGVEISEVANTVRSGKDCERKKGEIGFATLRGGDVIGDHTVIFAGEGERIELGHKASNREVFSRGAIRAAIWGSNQKPGFYSMKDVLSCL